jgi:hypothetical protein
LISNSEGNFHDATWLDTKDQLENSPLSAESDDIAGELFVCGPVQLRLDGTAGRNCHHEAGQPRLRP